MGIDFGGDSVKVSVVTLNRHVETVLDRDNHRKTSTLIAIKDGQVYFSEAAKNIYRKNPECVVWNIEQLLGRFYNDSSIQFYMKRNPYLNITKDFVTGGLLINFISSDLTFKPYELFALWLNEIASYVALHLSHSISDTLIVVDPTFDQARLDSIKSASNISNIHLLEITDSPRALATQFIVNKKHLLESEPNHIMFVDIGATNTISTIARMSIEKNIKKNTSFPSFTLLGIGYEPTGANDYDNCLKNYLISSFKEKKRIDTDIISNHKSNMKFVHEAASIKKGLSANKEARFVIEDAFQYMTHQGVIKRHDFESHCAEITQNIVKSCARAFESASRNSTDLKDVVLMGGGSVIPVIQDMLKEATGRTPSKYLNIEDSIAAGASILAAKTHKMFKVADMSTPAFVFYPIELEYNITVINSSESFENKFGNDLLYSHMSRQISKRILTLNNVTQDFSITVRYSKLPPSIPQNILEYQDLFKVEISEVNYAIETHTTYVPRRVMVYFMFDNFRMLTVSKVEMFMERNTTTGILGKMGEAVRNFFGSKNSSSESTSDNDQEQLYLGDFNTSAVNETQNPNLSAPEPLLQNLTIPLNFKIIPFYLPQPSYEDLLQSKQKLNLLYQKEFIRIENSKARSEVGDYIFEIEKMLDAGTLASYASESELKNLSDILASLKEWYDTEGHSANYTILHSKLSELKTAVSNVTTRIKQEAEREKLISSLKSTLNQTQSLIINSLNRTEFSEYLNITLAQDILNEIYEIEKWMEERIEEQGKLQPFDKPALTLPMLRRKNTRLDELAMQFYKDFQRAVTSSLKSNNATTTPSTTNETLKESATDKSTFTNQSSETNNEVLTNATKKEINENVDL